MTRTNKGSWVATAVLVAAGVFNAVASTGCDQDYVGAGDFLYPSVAPADFSPYGYDYDMYDLYTEDI